MFLIASLLLIIVNSRFLNRIIVFFKEVII